MTQAKRTPKQQQLDSYQHREATSPTPPDAGTQAQFRRKKPKQRYRYDSTLAPELNWDGQNAAREDGERYLRNILEAQTLEEAQAAASKLKAISRPFLNWSGKAERLSFDVPTLPLFVHERLSTQAIIETLKNHKLQQEFNFFGDPERSITDQVLQPYKQGPWTNRLILGDSLVVMNSLLRYENLGGQVQMMYIDPPYGVKFGSNFQPFVRKRNVDHNDDEDMTREPEMVQAYRDTWALGLHSYLTYLRDRLLLARELLTSSGSVFVQISDDNVHHVRELMDEVFGPDNFCSMIIFRKTTVAAGDILPATNDFLVWYAKDRQNVKIRTLFQPRLGTDWVNYDYVALPDGTYRRMNRSEKTDSALLPTGSKVYRRSPLTSPDFSETTSKPFEFQGRTYLPGNGHWKTSLDGLKRLAAVDRLEAYGTTLSYRRYIDDFPYFPISETWLDTAQGGYNVAKLYVVQTNTKVIERCVLMTTDPGDLVLDPTCGSGTTAYAAEEWGRRWIMIDTSRVPLALTRQRLLTATFPFYELKEESRGPAGGFVYQRKQNRKGQEIGGIIPHITLESIAKNEPPVEEILVDRPEILPGVTRVTGPFRVEATIPTPVDWEGDGEVDSLATQASADGSFVDRMLEVLRQSPNLHLSDNRSVSFRNIRPPAKSLVLNAEAMVGNGASHPVAFVFGPENGAVSENLVFQAAREAYAKSYNHLYVIGFAIQPNARELVENSADISVPATYVQATPDLLMGDLLKNMRSSQIFSVAGLPEISVHATDDGLYQVELLGMDVFDPITMEVDHRRGDDVPAWFLDTNYNDLCFHVSQAFFPRTGAWDNLKKALRGRFNEGVWDHLSGTCSEPFLVGDYRKIAVKVVDDRGNELLVVKALESAE